ncbi:DUF4834 family protein [uncultured Bacteroides sp.]|uniref:DUF4834 family protein n=1 Tax=uncultured Bacteroides sp. TaxID=162156 RepID=UPI002616A82A|nr:DUF4834 family protein [uncultured Bacteroides sp.]
MGFIQLLFFLLIAVVIIGLLIVVKVIFAIRKVTGNMFGKHSSKSDSDSRSSNYGNTKTADTQRSNRKKVFDDDEGEYVDFEEIKE